MKFQFFPLQPPIEEIKQLMSCITSKQDHKLHWWWVLHTPNISTRPGKLVSPNVHNQLKNIIEVISLKVPNDWYIRVTHKQSQSLEKMYAISHLLIIRFSKFLCPPKKCMVGQTNFENPNSLSPYSLLAYYFLSAP